MAVPAVIAWKEKDNVGTLVQIILYFLAFVMIIYTPYKLFGMFKDAGKKIEETLKDVGNTLNPKDFPTKAKETGKDIITMITKPGTPEGNLAQANVHYGGQEWEPGSAPPVNPNNPVLKRYGQEVKPGESKTFVGSTYIEKDVNNMVKDPWGGYTDREDALAHKYGFNSYANFNAWLQGAKAALKAEGKDPNSMTLDQIVAYGRELDKKKEEWDKEHPATFDVQHKDNTGKVVPQYHSQADYWELQKERWEAIAKHYPKPTPKPPVHPLPVLPRKGIFAR